MSDAAQNEYSSRFKATVKALREDLLARLPDHERLDRVTPLYESPQTLKDIRAVADDLRRLARLKPPK